MNFSCCVVQYCFSKDVISDFFQSTASWQPVAALYYYQVHAHELHVKTQAPTPLQASIRRENAQKRRTHTLVFLFQPRNSRLLFSYQQFKEIGVEESCGRERGVVASRRLQLLLLMHVEAQQRVVQLVCKRTRAALKRKRPAAVPCEIAASFSYRGLSH